MIKTININIYNHNNHNNNNKKYFFFSFINSLYAKNYLIIDEDKVEKK